MVFSACNRADDGLVTQDYSLNLLKGGSHTLATEVFDEVMEIGDETLDLYEMLLYHQDSSDEHTGHGGMGGGMGHGGMGGHGILGNMGHSGDTLVIGDMDEFMGSGHQHFRLSDCSVITREVNGDITEIIIDFGTVNCLCNDGKERRGKILMVKTGDYWEGEAQLNFTFQDYYVDDNQVLGTKQVNAFINGDGNRESSIVDEGTMIRSDNGGTITWNADKQRIVVKGSKTSFKMDDVIEVTGISSGQLADGKTFSSHTETPLVRIHHMNWMGGYVSGIVVIEISDGTVIRIDYKDVDRDGDGHGGGIGGGGHGGHGHGRGR